MELRNPARSMFLHRGFSFLFIIFLSWMTSQARAQKVECRQRPMDIVFVIDGSRSVRPWNFKTVQDAVKDMVDAFDKIGANETRIGLVQYSSRVREEFALDSYYTKEEVNRAIDAVEYMEKGTMTGRALQFITEKSFTEAHGARSNDPRILKVAVVITDGRAQDRTVPIWQKRAKDSGIVLFAIGVGRRISDKDLLLIASEPKEKHKFYVKNFDLIGRIPVMLHEQICDIDECKEEIDNCDQICNNTIGSFYCGCHHGFVLAEDRATCKPVTPSNLVDLAILNKTHTSMRASWRLISPEKEHLIDHYVVKIYTATTGEFTEMRVNEPTALLEGLKPGTPYIIRVTAYTADGLKSETIEGEDTTLFLGETRLDLFNATLTTLQAKWEPAGGDLLSGYVLKLTKVIEGLNGGVSPDMEKIYEFESDVTGTLLEGLQPGQKYKGVITPYHARKLPGGPGEDTETTKTLQAPTIRVTGTTLTTVDVEFTDVGMPADRYVLELTDDETGEVKTVEVDGSESTATFHGCKPGAEFIVTVKGYVRENDIEYESPEGSTTGTTKTIIPPIVTIPTTTLSTVDVEWTGIGVEADKYTVILEPVEPGTGEAKEVTVDGSLTSTTIYGLDPDTVYRATVTGTVVDDGKEIESPVGSAEGKTKRIPAPVVDVIDTGLATADVLWTISGYTPTSFEVTYYLKSDPENKKTFTTEDISAKLEDLEPGSEVVVEVVAVDYDDDRKFTSEPGSDSEFTKSLHAPPVMANGRTYTTAVVKWGGIGLPADEWELTYYPIGGTLLEKIETLTLAGDVNKTVLTNLDHNTEYEVTVVGLVREGGKIYPSPVGKDTFILGAIDPPVVTIPRTDTTSINAEWKDKVDADNYIVSITEVGSDDVTTITVDGEITAKIFDFLTPGTKYEVQVIIQVDDEGNVIQSPPGKAIGITRPEPPIDLKIVDPEPTKLTVTFEPPKGGYEYFEAKCVPEGADPESVPAIRVERDDRSVTCDDLIPGTRYRVIITTFYGGLESDPAIIDAVLPVDAPTNFDLSDPTVHSILATWDPPPNVDEVIEYRLTLKSDELGTMVEKIIPGTETSYLFTDLNPLTKYDGDITAVVGESVSPPATDTETTLPDKIMIEVIDISYNNITVEWTPSSHPGVVTQILTYTRQPDSDASGDTPASYSQTVRIDPGTTRYVIMGVKPATIYDVSIQYVYRLSTSDTATTQATTLAPPPGPPYGTNITDVHFIVNWGFPEYGAEPLGYTVTYVPSHGEMVVETEIPSGEILNLEVNDATPSTKYNVTVVANYGYDIISDPVDGEVKTKDPEEEQVCTCNTYLSKQSEMQSTVNKLVSVIERLTRKIEDMERSVSISRGVAPIILDEDESFGVRRGDHGI